MYSDEDKLGCPDDAYNIIMEALEYCDVWSDKYTNTFEKDGYVVYWGYRDIGSVDPNGHWSNSHFYGEILFPDKFRSGSFHITDGISNGTFMQSWELFDSIEDQAEGYEL